MDKTVKEIEQIDFEKIVWIAVAISALLTLYADSLQKKYLLYNDINDQLTAKKIYFILLIVSITIYAYFSLRNYNDLEDYKNTDKENLYNLRFIASLLFLIGALLLLYFQSNVDDSIGIETI